MTDLVDVTLLREQVERLWYEGQSWCSMAKACGFTRMHRNCDKPQGDASRFQRIIGVRRHSNYRQKRLQARIHYLTAIKIADALHLDPTDCGL